MKKRILPLMLASVFTASTLFVACSDDDDKGLSCSELAEKAKKIDINGDSEESIKALKEYIKLVEESDCDEAKKQLDQLKKMSGEN